MFRTFRLFARPSFTSGVARLVDLGGVYDKYNTSKSEQRADARAIRSDWASVGVDLESSLQRVTKELLASR